MLEEEVQTIIKASPLLLCFLGGFWEVGCGVKERNPQPSAVSGPVLASPFFRLCGIPIDLPTEEERLAWTAFPFCFFCFSSIPLHQRETIVLFQRSALALLILFFCVLCSCNDTTCRRRSCKRSSWHFASFLGFGEAGCPAKEPNCPQSVGAVCHYFSIFEDLLYTNQLSN